MLLVTGLLVHEQSFSVFNIFFNRTNERHSIRCQVQRTTCLSDRISTIDEFTDLFSSLLSANPDRSSFKRERRSRSAHPLNIEKETSVVRYIFASIVIRLPLSVSRFIIDINCFKPIELRARWARRRHIKPSLSLSLSLSTHGHTKS